MNRRRNTLAPFGFINCDKPIGMTSRDVVNIVAGCFRKTKVGHSGTLDPLAEGVLVLGIGRAVRLVSYVQQQRKYYRATFLLGQSSESGDLETALQHHPELAIPTLNQLESAAASLVGNIDQIPPAHSAIKINGKRAYDRIRAGQTVKMPSRQVEIHHFKITRYEYPEVDMDVCCGSGTYIRTLGMDLATAAGSAGVMKSLKRYGVGVFREDQSIPIDTLRTSDPTQFLLPAMMSVGGMPQFKIDEDQATRVVNGLDIDLPDSDELLIRDTEVAAVLDGELLAIMMPKRNSWWPKRVFPRS